MDIPNLKKQLEDFLVFLLIHFKLILNPHKLVKHILNESNMKLSTKSIMLFIMNFIFFNFITDTFDSNKIIQYKPIPVFIIVFSIVMCICFFFIFLSLRITKVEKIKLSIFSSIFIFSTVLPIRFFIMICFLLTEKYFFYYFLFLFSFISNLIIFIYYPICFNTKFFRLISIVISYSLFVFLNSAPYLLIREKPKNSYFVDPIFYESIEKSQHYLNTAKYINENERLLIGFMENFSSEFDHSYYDLINDQIITIINKRGELEDLLSRTIFNRNKKIPNIILESIALYEQIHKEYSRLILNPHEEAIDELKKYFIQADVFLTESKKKIDEFYQEINKSLNDSSLSENKKEIFFDPLIVEMEIENLNKKIKTVSELIVDKKRQMDILSAEMSINIIAVKEINNLLEKLNTTSSRLIKEVENYSDYLRWRPRMPF